jgi:dienelactone hydrolase
MTQPRAPRQPCAGSALRRMLAGLVLIVALLMLARAPAKAETLAERAAMLEPSFTISLPDGAGPFPVVIMLHGCGGRRGFLDTYARVAREAGAASVIVDSYTPRGVSRHAAFATICTGLTFRGAERAGDLYAVVNWTRAQSWADPDRLIAAGWSHGGWTVLDALALRSGHDMQAATGLRDLPEEPLAGVRGAFVAYPYAGVASLAGRRAWRHDVDAVAIVCGRDYIVGAAAPRAALERQRSLGAKLDIEMFPHATHAFDEPGAHDPRVRYSAEDSAKAEAMLASLIARVRATHITDP